MVDHLKDTYLFTDDVRGVMCWLERAAVIISEIAQGDITTDITLTLPQLQQLLARLPPAPPKLQERWAQLVWPMPGEPYLVYLLRCLSFHRSLTRLSPCIGFSPSSWREAEGVAPRPPAHTLADLYAGAMGGGGDGLAREVCRVVGLRAVPSLSDLAQVGYTLQPCSAAACRPRTAAATSSPSSSLALPFYYGGEHCPHCGLPFTLQPQWCQRRYLVLERAGGARSPAVVFTDRAAAVLQIGAVVDVWHYRCSGGGAAQQQALLVVHHAQPATQDRSLAVLQDVSPVVLPPSFAALRGQLAGHIAGQEQSKGLLLLSLLHTLYRALRPPRHRWPPLHLLLVGPAKSGKSALLQSVAALYAQHGNLVGRTVVHRSSGRAGLQEALPRISGDVLLGGPALCAGALLLDGLGAAADRPALLQLLGGSCRVVEPSAGADVLPSRTQVTATAQDEDRALPCVLDRFALVATVTAQLSLVESTAVGASATRSVSTSQARSLDRCHSASNHNNHTSASRSRDDPFFLTATAAPPSLSAELLRCVVLRAPGEEELYQTALRDPSVRAFFLEKLLGHPQLLEAAALPASGALPPPASQRGEQHHHKKSGGGSTMASRAHLHVLQQLLLARLLVGDSQPQPVPLSGHGAAAALNGAAAPVRDLALADEVWRAYHYHLQCRAALVDRMCGGGRGGTAAGAANMMLPPPPSSVPPAACFLYAAHSVQPPRPPLFPSFQQRSNHTNNNNTFVVNNHLKRRRGSKKAMKMYFLECLQQQQQQQQQHTKKLSENAEEGAGYSGAVNPTLHQSFVTRQAAASLFEALGGSAAMGDPLEMVVQQLQQAGCLLQRAGGWQVVMI